MTELSGILSSEDMDKAVRKGMPDWISPMLARLTHEHFSSEDWIYERKLDGERVISCMEKDGRVRLLSRNGKEINSSYPEIEEALSRQSPRGIVLDGEVVAFSSDGISDFQKLQPRMQASSREQASRQGVKVFYYVFDCPYSLGYDLSSCRLRARKKLLRELIDWTDPLMFTPHRNGKGLEYYREACRKGWEGIIAKKADSRYLHGRSSRWLKFKCVMQQEFIIGGYTEPGGDRPGLGALLLGYYRVGELRYAGKVGTGFDEGTLRMLASKLGSLERKTPPFSDPPEDSGTRFVSPELVCEVAFTEWTSDGRLRHPSCKGLRRDKDPADVTREDETSRTVS